MLSKLSRPLAHGRGKGTSPDDVTDDVSFTNEIQPAPSLSPIFPRINDSRATRGCFSSSPPPFIARISS